MNTGTIFFIHPGDILYYAHRRRRNEPDYLKLPLRMGLSFQPHRTPALFAEGGTLG